MCMYYIVCIYVYTCFWECNNWQLFGAHPSRLQIFFRAPYFRIEALTSQLLSALIRGISWGTFFLVWHPEISIEFDGFENKYWNWSLVFTMMSDVRLLAKFACSTFPTNIRQRLLLSGTIKGSTQTIILYLQRNIDKKKKRAKGKD